MIPHLTDRKILDNPSKHDIRKVRSGSKKTTIETTGGVLWQRKQRKQKKP